MTLETKAKPTEAELGPIKKELKGRIYVVKFNFGDEESDLNRLARNYYEVAGLNINKELLDTIANSYQLGYERMRQESRAMH